MRHRVLAVIAALMVCLPASACSSSSRTDDDYRHKVANTAQALNGTLGTVDLALHVVDKNRIPAPYVSVALADADDDASSTSTNFDAIQPPSHAADELRKRLDDTMQKTLSMLDDLRIEARRGHLHELSTTAAPLQRLRHQLTLLQNVAG